jgi:KTSC domain
MHVTAVESTTLATVAYDDAAGILQLEFRSGAAYRYFDVPLEMREGLLQAPSKGGYFNRQIRKHFRYVRVATAGEA